jgi:hypothetical protein
MSKDDTAAQEAEATASAEAEAQAEAERAAIIAEEEAQASLLVSLVQSADRLVGKVRTALGARIDRQAFLMAENGTDWKERVQEITGLSMPVVYKIRQAGAVARVLSLPIPDLTEEEAENLSVASSKLAHLPGFSVLVPWYRLLKEADNAKERTEAEAKIVKAWNELTENGKRLPTREESEAKASRYGKRPTAPTEEETPADGTDRNEPTEGDSPSETLTITLDTAGLESLSKDLGGQVKILSDEFSIPNEAVRAIMLAALRFGAERGYGNVTSVLAQ